MGCPDAVRAAVLALPGVVKIAYEPQGDVFLLEFDATRVRLEDIFAAVVHGGKKMGQEYRPRLIA